MLSEIQSVSTIVVVDDGVRTGSSQLPWKRPSHGGGEGTTQAWVVGGQVTAVSLKINAYTSAVTWLLGDPA